MQIGARKARVRYARIGVALLLVGALGAAGGAFVVAQTTTPAAKREALAAGAKVKGDKHRTLGLSRVVIPAGAKLALHHHLGTQVAFIQAGTLSYTVRDGGVVVRTGPADGDNRVVRKIKAGQTGRIRPGQWIVEQPSDIHQAANNGKAKIVIYLGTLLRTGAPPSTPVN